MQHSHQPKNEVSKAAYLIILPANVGDALCSTPAIKLLRDNCPDAQIDVLVSSEASRQLILHNPCINHVISLSSIKHKKTFSNAYSDRLVLINIPKERAIAEQFGKAYRCSDAPNPLHLYEVGIALINKMFPDKKYPPSESYFLYPQASDFQSVKEKLKKGRAALVSDEILIGCHIGCNKAAARALKFWKREIASFRTWPFERFYQLTQHFKDANPNIKWVLTGTLGEQKIINKFFKKRENIIDLTTQTSIHELAALMHFCKIFLSGDTGPMHIACTTPISMISLFGSTRPSVSGPRPMRNNIIVLQGKNAITDITIEEVTNAILRLLPVHNSR